ncbi:hypothetical protein Dxin01_00977 [Deinococcus xinjiangensis]|uniref:Uncharacterized protein n=1 Tax=Deinococcus xinjiangensis TaxID=457454 RepID=A0ABP9VAP3_9DEIO
MNRARLIGTLLGLILLACAAVIYFDQQGAFGGNTANTPTTTPTTAPTTAPTTTPTDNSGYGGLK